MLEKIEADLGPDSFNIYKAAFTSFVKGEIDFATYQQKMVEILGLNLLPFHQRFVKLFRKRVVENKSLQRFKSILIRIKEDKREARLTKLKMIKGEHANSSSYAEKYENDFDGEQSDDSRLCSQCGLAECKCDERFVKQELGKTTNGDVKMEVSQSQPGGLTSDQVTKAAGGPNAGKTSEPKSGGISRSQSFVIDPKRIPPNNPNERIVMTALDRKGSIHPGLKNLIGTDDDEYVRVNHRKRRRLNSRDSDFEPNEESKLGDHEGADSPLSKQKDAQLGADSDAELPFRIVADRKN